MKNNMSLGDAIGLYINEHPIMATFSITILSIVFTGCLFFPGTRAVAAWLLLLLILYILGHSIYHIFLNKTKR